MIKKPEKPYYLGGPMSGIPQFNFPEFDRITKLLREDGWYIRSPAELDSLEVRKDALDSDDGMVRKGAMVEETWSDFLARDVIIVNDLCSGIILIPGWEKSRGACLECYVAMSGGKPVYAYIENSRDGYVVTPIPYSVAGTYILKQLSHKEPA